MATYLHAKSIVCFIEGKASLRSYDSAPRPRPPPTPLSPRKARPLATHRKTEKERQDAAARRGEGGGSGADSYDRQKRWPSINHSILSTYMLFCGFLQILFSFLKH